MPIAKKMHTNCF